MIVIALCLIIGVLAGHPSTGLIAGDGAMAVASISAFVDSRIAPMILAMFLSTLIGMTVGHNGYSLLIASASQSFVFGLHQPAISTSPHYRGPDLSYYL